MGYVGAPRNGKGRKGDKGGNGEGKMGGKGEIIPPLAIPGPAAGMRRLKVVYIEFGE